MNQILVAIHSWIAAGSAAAVAGCFLWGMASVLLSPCHLASIPLIVGYVGGQNEIVRGLRAAGYAVLFTTGLFITIAVIGLACALLGGLLGDVGTLWTIPVGLVLLWVALDMLGVARCSVSGSLMGRLRLRGAAGAFALGLAYGILSGSCTFGFIAPILAVITIQEKIATGVLLIAAFGAGHCLPIALAGSSTAWVRKWLDNSTMPLAASWFRRAAGFLVGLLGLYFIARPFVS